ncbi:MAG: ATP-binding cassette domain-containing protein [Thermoplasmata archaeon]|nr:ATP-binding cassette domain-containing protein [Thermoplasmata archaeon]
MKALSMRDVRFMYEGSDRWALDGISVEIEKGEFVSVLGSNLSGKSTLCMLTNGLAPHTLKGKMEGRVEVFGKDTSGLSVAELATSVGMVFQEPDSQLFCMSVEEEVAFGPENLAVPRDEIRARVDWALGLVGMRGYNDRSPFSLSGGQKQRVAIAAALSMRPEMLVLDEPAYALDPLGRLELYSVLRELRQDYGMTIVIAERDSEEAIAFSDRIVLMKGGRIVDSGTPKDFAREPNRLRTVGVVPTQLSEISEMLNARIKGGNFQFLRVEEASKAIIENCLASRAGGAR